MCNKGYYNELQQCELELIFKSSQSSNCSLKPENMKQESLVIAYHHDAVNFKTLSHTQPVRRRKLGREDTSGVLYLSHNMFVIEFFKKTSTFTVE